MGLKIVCVNAGNYLGRGKEYVQILADMVARNIHEDTPYEFICFTDDGEGLSPEICVRDLSEGLRGWWNKLYLFKGGLFSPEDRIIYFDLDTVITGDLSDIINYAGDFCILRDFYRPDGLQSSVMSWKGDSCAHIWQAFEAAAFPEIEGGDQAWIENHANEPNTWQDVLSDQCVSFKVHARSGIPKGARVVVFHGKPRPHEVLGWVQDFWKIGGGVTIDGVCGNTEEAQLVSNIDYSTKLCRTWLDHAPEHKGHAVICGGGPSIKKDVEEIKQRQKDGQAIFALNNSWHYLIKHGIEPKVHVMLDARPQNADFVPAPSLQCAKYYASQCAKEVWDKAPDAHLWNHLNALKILENDNRANVFIAGGSTVGLNAMSIAHILGYRNIHLYGFDSSYDDDQNHHAYIQHLNDKERVIQVTACGKPFTCAAWMAQQVNEFTQLVPQLLALGCEITVHGDGMLPYVARQMNNPVTDNIVERDGIWWPEHDMECHAIMNRTLEDIVTIMYFVKDRRICVQAGGNVGIWPKMFSHVFDAVYTFEPDPLNYKCLTKNCPQKNIFHYQEALGASQKMTGYKRVNGNCGSGQISEGSDIIVRTIDSLALPSCGLIQLDIEGYELNALKGAVDTIRRFSPVIVVEDKGLSEKYGSKKGDIADYLAGFGYSIAKSINRDIIFTKET